METKLILAAVVFSFLFVSGCVQNTSSSVQPTTPTVSSQKTDWLNTELTDVNTGKTFKINDFKGKPILLETFAVWCPTCLAQQKEVQKVKTSKGDAVIHISLNVDPNEDASKVKAHLQKYNFDWYFAVSPINFTTALKNKFGVTVLNAPSAPVILICGDQSARLLSNGVKSAKTLEQQIQKGC